MFGRSSGSDTPRRRPMHTQRLSPSDLAPDGYQAIVGVATYIRKCGIEQSLIELVQMRASQINGCAYCLDMHSRDARRQGETEQRLYLLNAWRESPLYTARERAALAWNEALTQVARAHPTDAEYQALREHFTDKEIIDLTILIGLINQWNRLAIAMGFV